MITRIEVASAQPGAPDLPLGQGFMPYSDPIQLRSIEGLGPVKADLASTPYATGRGELYQGVSTGKRNIVLTLGLNPNWVDYSMMELRQLLYRYFMPESQPTLKFFSDELPAVYINGVVESCEPNIFSQDPEMQVSLLCHKPDFIDIDATVLHGDVDGVSNRVDYIGTAPVGFSLLLSGSDDLPDYTGSFTVTNWVGNKAQTFSADSLHVDQTADRYVEINTVRSDRHIYSRTPNRRSNLLAKVVSNSAWVELIPGRNFLTFSADKPGLKWSLGYFNRFGGL